MPDDPFRDLSRSRGAAERLSELDEEPEARPSPDAPPAARPDSRYTWVVGVVALVAIVFVIVNLIGVGVGESNLGPDPGERLPDFAAPLATGELEGDANVRQGETGSQAEGPVPACDVDEPDVVNICELRRRPVVLTFVLEGCEGALDEVERVRREFPGVAFVGVLSESPEEAEDIVAPGRWGFPVALDPDNAVSILYRAGDCPTTVFAGEGGEVVGTELGFLTPEELRGNVAELAGRGTRP